MAVELSGSKPKIRTACLVSTATHIWHFFQNTQRLVKKKNHSTHCPILDQMTSYSTVTTSDITGKTFDVCLRYLDKAHSNGAHLGKLVDHFKAVVDRLGEQLGKQLVVEYLQAAATRDFTDGGRVETVLVVTVPTLDKNAAVTQAFCVHLSAHIVKMDSYE